MDYGLSFNMDMELLTPTKGLEIFYSLSWMFLIVFWVSHMTFSFDSLSENGETGECGVYDDPSRN